MSRALRLLSSVVFLSLPLVISPVVIRAQSQPSTSPGKPSSDLQASKQTKPDNSTQESFVIELSALTCNFENDGTEDREMIARIHVLSDAGVQHWGLLSFPYQKFNQTLDIEYVRVKKPDGTVVLTPPENTQEITSEITRIAPFYTDTREKHVAVKGLTPGDVLEYSFRLTVTKPLVPDQFWMEYEFEHDQVVMLESLEVSVPAGREIKVKNRGPKYEMKDQGGRRIYRWTSSNPVRKEENDEDEGAAWKQARGQQDQPDVLLSSFRSWDEIGHWYDDLQRERVKPTTDIQAKAAELTKNAADESAKLKALYSFVSTRYRYIGVALGLGRYQPHPASEVMDNGYGDCKDKHTLLASLLTAAGFEVYPALISAQSDIDPDVPSPGQFNHVITAVVLRHGILWLDTTSEVAPFGFLVGPLRGKKALVVKSGASAVLETVPMNPEFKSSQTFEMKAKLDANGTLTGDAERTLAGSDFEVMLRSGFRSLAMPQWKDLVQRISYGSGFGGEVSDVTASSPEDLSQPFRISYKYTRKDYSDWGNRRISPPLPVMYLPDIKEGKKKSTAPIYLGVPGEVHFHSTVELPKDYTLELPNKVDVKEDFAEYHAEYSVTNGILVTDRHLTFFVPEVPVSQYEKYAAFRKQVNDDRDLLISLSNLSKEPHAAGTTNTLSEAIEKTRQAVWALPSSSDPVAAQYENDARDALMRNDIASATTSLRSAANKDPKFARAWLVLGSLLEAQFQRDAALEAYRNAVSANPKRGICHKLLGFALMGSGKYEEAVSTFQGLIKVDPEDNDAQANLGNALKALRRYSEAATALEVAVKRSPDKVSLQMGLADAYLGAGDTEKAHAVLQQVIKLDSSPMVLNEVAYSLAEKNMDLDMAKEYAEKAVATEEEAARKLQVSDLKPADLVHTQTLTAFWDTLGWVYYRRNELADAERYLTPAWQLSQRPVIGEHLGHVYERQGKKISALRTYQLARASAPQRIIVPGTTVPVQNDRALDEDIKRLGGKPESGLSGDLSLMRTYRLSRIVNGTGSAEFLVLIGPGKSVESKFESGDDSLKSSAKNIATIKFNFTLPSETTRLVWKGLLGCYQYSGCSLVMMIQ
jgi:tetratricopeptide (TPR) repeat protein/transglutaminase-like putative cysteine protease